MDRDEAAPLTMDEAVASIVAENTDTPPVDEAEAPEESDNVEVDEADEDAEQDADEGNSDDESEVEETDDDSQESEADDLVEVFDGKDWIQVTREEAKGYGLRQADYTRKATEVAEQRREVEAAKAEAAALKAEIAEQKQQLQDQLAQWAIAEAQEPNWGELLQNGADPRQVMIAQSQWQERKQQQERAKAAYQELVGQTTAEQIERAKDEILEAVPEWQDDDVRIAEFNQMMKTAQDLGFTPEELDKTTDSRVFIALREVAKYREMQAAKPAVTKKVAKANKALAPNAKVTGKERQGAARKKAEAAYRKEPTMENVLKMMAAS